MAKLFFYYSAMNAGKSTTLLQSAYNYQERGMDVLLFTPSFDDRYEVGTVTSRIGLKSDAVMFDKDFDVFAYTQKEQKKLGGKLACVLVDEAHFMTKQHIEQLTEIADKLNLPVLAYGLRTDFQGEPFEGSKYLLAWAENLIEIKTICHCSRKATMNMRVAEDGSKVHEGDQVEIGGNDRYVSTCRKHYKAGESASVALKKAS